jgi:hypothetical protein
LRDSTLDSKDEDEKRGKKRNLNLTNDSSTDSEYIRMKIKRNKKR